MGMPRALWAGLLAAGLLAAAGPLADAAGSGGGPAASASTAAVQSELAGQVVVPAGTTLQGDVRMVAGEVDVLGTLTGSVALTVGQVAVGPQGRIQGGVTIAVGQVEVQPGGSISGAVTAGSGSAQQLACPATADATCVLAGGPTGWRSHSSLAGVPWKGMLGRVLHLGWLGWLGPAFHLLGWLGTLALALPVAALFPHPLGTVRRQIETDPGRSALVGLAVLLLALPVLVLVSITIVGIPAALAAALALVGAWFLGYVGLAALIGERTLRLGGWRQANPLLALLAGSLLILVGEWVPLLGGLVWLAVACVGTGAALLTRFGTRPAAPAPIQG